MVGIVTVTTKNQITLPVELMECLNLNKGSKLWVDFDGEKTLMLEKVEEWKDLREEMLKNPLVEKYAGYSWEKIMKIAGKREARRIANEGKLGRH